MKNDFHKKLDVFLRVSAEDSATPANDDRPPLPRAMTDHFQQWAATTISRLLNRVKRLEKLNETKDQKIAVLEARVFKDGLTGAFNREYLATTLAAANHDRRIAKGDQLLYIDLSRFKEINDTYGHAAGDQALRETVKFLTSCVRETDIVARLGGDEFVVALLGADKTAACQKASAITKGFSQLSITVDGRQVPVRGNVGIYMVDDPHMPLDDMLECADLKMYEAKMSAADYRPRGRDVACA